MVEQDDWRGLVYGRTDGSAEVSVQAFTPGPPIPTFSSPFRVVGSDRLDYFVKSLDNCPAGMGATLAAEFVAAAAGRLINAPVVRTVLIEIPAALAGHELSPGRPMSAGLAHASQAMEHADEGRGQLAARSQDDNRVRHAGVYALFDWCYGSDQQWLYDIDDDRRIYSHDHGLYLPYGWMHDQDLLVAMVDDPHPLPDPPAGLSPVAVQETAERLEAVTRADLASILNRVPVSWPVTDQLLETLGWFLERRAPAAAARIRDLLATPS